MFALVSLGLLGSPLFALYCGGSAPAAMACCQDDPQGCNRMGKSDDCCRTLPNDGSETATLVLSAQPSTPMHAVALIPICVSTVLDLTTLGGRHPLVAAAHLPLDLPPPLLSALRL